MSLIDRERAEGFQADCIRGTRYSRERAEGFQADCIRGTRYSRERAEGFLGVCSGSLRCLAGMKSAKMRPRHRPDRSVP